MSTYFGELAFGEPVPGYSASLAADLQSETSMSGVLDTSIDLAADMQSTAGMTASFDELTAPDTAWVQSVFDGLYIDLRVTADDLTLDVINEPVLLADRDCIAQDCKHRIRESGLLLQMVGQRTGAALDLLYQRLELLVEEDVRLVPGTVEITRPTLEKLYITATTADFGLINFTVVI